MRRRGAAGRLPFPLPIAWVALVLCGAGPVGAQPPTPSYPITIEPGFHSVISAEEAANLALESVARPITLVPAPSGGLAMEPPLPRVLEVVGCRGADLPAFDPRVGGVDDPYVWYVRVRGSIYLIHGYGGTDVEGFVLIDVRTGLVFSRGVFLDPAKHPGLR